MSTELPFIRASRPVVGFPDYSITADGRIWSWRNKRWMKMQTAGTGYPMLYLTRNGEHHMTTVHRLVWEAFNGPIPRHLQINHLNGVRHDNRLENLEVCTPSENLKHSYRHLGRKANYRAANNARAKLTEGDVREIRKLRGLTHREIAKQYGVAYSLITRIIARKSWRHIQ